MTTSQVPPPPRLEPVRSPDAAQASARALAEQLEATLARASSFSKDERNTQVEGEWSTVESLRHLVFVIDLWLSKTILGRADPFHPIGKPPDFMPAALPGTLIDPDARPTFEEACDVLRERIAGLQDYVQRLSPDELSRVIESHAGTVGGALAVIIHELGAHNGFMNRDLDKIAASRA